MKNLARAYKRVHVAGRDWWYFDGAMLNVDDVVRIGHDGHRATIEALDVRAGRNGYWKLPILLPTDRDDDDPAELIGFKVQEAAPEDPVGPRLVFADGETPARGVVAIVRAMVRRDVQVEDLVEVWRPPYHAPQLFAPRPYPWRR